MAHRQEGISKKNTPIKRISKNVTSRGRKNNDITPIERISKDVTPRGR